MKPMVEYDAPAERTGLEIAIVGMQARFPGAQSTEAYWANLRDGVESITHFSKEELRASGIPPRIVEAPNYVAARGIVEEAMRFDASFFKYLPGEALTIDPQQRAFLECAWAALEDAAIVPRTFDGGIGVFAGVGSNGFAEHLRNDPRLRGSDDGYQVRLGSDKDYVATRTSYKLGLEGPGYTVQTGCSTSLVAVHLARQSLISGECRAALAGGATIHVPQRAGQFHTEGSAFSPDGACRPFDANGEGTVNGEGVAVVVLKRLDDALADGDVIHAVIRGSAVNNDGMRKAGFTAPSVDGQAEVVRMSHRAANVHPRSIGYVEAHGTGTPLGDPIEVKALTAAFRRETDAQQYCALGSVKSNIGHTDAAAGVAGLIKAALSVRDGVIVPTLHFTAPNPRAELDTSPFYVPTETRPWEEDGGRRTAAVSSFGVGGTNAHLILEEPPRRRVRARAKAFGVHVLPLSAKTETALAQRARDVKTHLASDAPEEDAARTLGDVAHTLQYGRDAFSHRSVVVAQDRSDAADQLEELAALHAETVVPASAHRPVAFAFPGGGEDLVNVVPALYATVPAFTDAMDRCATLLQDEVGLDVDVRAILATAPNEDDARRSLRRPPVLLASLFAVEYALAQVWMRWGVTPSRVFGHSFGEYVAACIAGVFALRDGLSLAVERGRLFEGLDRGAMISVNLSADRAREYVDATDGVDLAVVNASEICVCSGRPDAVDALAQRLEADGVEVRTLDLPRAGHSHMVDPIVDPLVEHVRSIPRSAPSIPLVSSVTGEELPASTVTDPDYWGRHLRDTVRFTDCIGTVLDESGCVVLEVGPGNGVCSLVQRHPDYDPARHVATPSGGPDGRLEPRVLVHSLGTLWSAGLEVDWSRVYTEGDAGARVPLATYPFEGKEYTLHIPSSDAAHGASAQDTHAHGANATGANGTGANATEEGSTNGAGANGAGANGATGGSTEANAGANGEGVDRPPPLDEIERTVRAHWVRLLGTSDFDANDSFFDLGGHSFLATQCLNRIRRDFDVSLSMRTLFAASSVRELSLEIHRVLGAGTAIEEGDVEALQDEAALPPDVGAATDETAIPDTVRTVFLTGATGYLGAHLLHALLQTPVSNVACLMRADNAEAGRERLTDALRTFDRWEPAHADRITAVPGDLEAENLGLSAAQFDAWAEATDAVVHAGARVHFTTPYRTLRAANVRGTETLLRLATTGQTVSAFHHVSTLAVFPYAESLDDVVLESDPLPTSGVLPNGYAQSKYVAERSVEQARERGFPVSVYRPGAVLGDTQTGQSRKDDTVWRMMKGCIQLGIAPHLPMRIPAAPVDFVSRAIVWLVHQRRSYGGTFHVVDADQIDYNDFFDMLAGAGYPVERVPFETWYDSLQEHVAQDADNALFPLAHTLGREPDLVPEFGTEALQGALRDAPFECPSLTQELFARYVRYFERTGFLDDEVALAASDAGR